MTYEEQRRRLIEYLLAKVHIADWHGVRDAAVDIEILEAKHYANEDLHKLQRNQASDS